MKGQAHRFRKMETQSLRMETQGQIIKKPQGLQIHKIKILIINRTSKKEIWLDSKGRWSIA